MKIPERDLERVIRTELAVVLYQKDYLSKGQARKIAKLSNSEFINKLGKRKIHRHYYGGDLEDDIKFSGE